jgi:hypothetical protein
MPMIFRATDRTLRELGETVARDSALTPSAKDRLMKFLTNLDRELPKVNEKASAQITLEALLPQLERLAAVLHEAPLPDASTPGLADVAGMVDRVALIIQTARDGRRAEAEALLRLNAFDPSTTTHGNVMTLLEKLEKSNDRQNRGNAAKSARGKANERLDAHDGAGRSGRSAGTVDAGADSEDAAADRPDEGLRS